MTNPFRSAIVVAALVTTIGQFPAQQASAQQAFPQEVRTQKANVRLEEVARGLDHPWGFAFLPDGRILVTERSGNLRVVDRDGRLSQPLAGTPRVAARAQGGLLDVVIDPDFASNRFIYFSYSEPREGGNATTVARARLNVAGTALESPTPIFRQQPAYNGGHHFGSRIVFDRQGHLFVTLGDRYDLKDQAQNPANHIGKVVRIRKDGGAAPGNPTISGWAPEVWSIGHRNVQGATLHPVTGQLWTAEHGARGGDEVNTPEAGKNYGWPVITYGRDYSGARIGEGTAKAGMEQPLFWWDPSMAPSGMTFYTGDRFPAWRGSVFVGALAQRHLSRLETEGGRVTGEEKLLEGLNMRIRDVRQGPDGNLYVLTDQPAPEGKIIRLSPAR
jgi:aldose sugar dehydrogenase